MKEWKEIPSDLLKTQISPFDAYLELHPTGRFLRQIPSFYFKYRHNYPLLGEAREIVDELIRRHYETMVYQIPSKTDSPVASKV